MYFASSSEVVSAAVEVAGQLAEFSVGRSAAVEAAQRRQTRHYPEVPDPAQAAAETT